MDNSCILQTNSKVQILEFDDTKEYDYDNTIDIELIKVFKSQEEKEEYIKKGFIIWKICIKTGEYLNLDECCFIKPNFHDNFKDRMIIFGDILKPFYRDGKEKYILRFCKIITYYLTDYEKFISLIKENVGKLVGMPTFILKVSYVNEEYNLLNVLYNSETNNDKKNIIITRDDYPEIFYKSIDDLPKTLDDVLKVISLKNKSQEFMEDVKIPKNGEHINSLLKLIKIDVITIKEIIKYLISNNNLKFITNLF